VAGKKAEEAGEKSEANQVPAKVEEKAAGNKLLIIAKNVASAAIST
jgi:hypothetical protein